MAPSRRRSTTAQKKTTTMPSKRGEQAEKGQQQEENSTEQEFESELSGAFSLLSVEGSPSKVRTSDLGKLLLAIGAGEIAEMKPLESIVDINHSGFFTREKVRLKGSFVVENRSFGIQFFFTRARIRATMRTTHVHALDEIVLCVYIIMRN